MEEATITKKQNITKTTVKTAVNPAILSKGIFSFHRFWQIVFVTKNAPKAQSPTGTKNRRKPKIAIRTRGLSGFNRTPRLEGIKAFVV